MRVTEKGQVTIPKAIRERFGLYPGTEIKFEEKDHKIVVEKAGGGDVWDRYYGFLKLKMRTDDVMRLLRGRP